MRDTLRISHFEPASYANGPGRRAVLWVQGCSLGCPGCFNPHTHSPRSGQERTVDALWLQIAHVAHQVDGLTVSGGEPFQQRRPLMKLLRRVRFELGLPVIVWTGFTWDELQRMPEFARLPVAIDAIIAGRFEQTRRIAQGMRGSENKTIHLLSAAYTLADFAAVPVGEIIIAPDGQVTASGVDPLQIGGSL